MKKAFILLDKDNTGSISYDVKKLSECKHLFQFLPNYLLNEILIHLFYIKFNLIFFIIDDNLRNLHVDQGSEDQVLISFDQFMKIMTNNIIKNRETYGRDKIVFESGINIFNIFHLNFF